MIASRMRRAFARWRSMRRASYSSGDRKGRLARIRRVAHQHARGRRVDAEMSESRRTHGRELTDEKVLARHNVML